MANRSYLVATDQETIYPSFAESSYSPDEQTVAQGIYCVPLLWLALFRPENMRVQPFTSDGRTVEGIAPIAETARALEQFDSAVRILNQAFTSQGTFDDYAAMLRTAVSSLRKKFVTIESEEIACLSEPESFYAHVRYALGTFAGEIPLPVGRASLLKLSELDSTIRLPPAGCLIDGSERSDEEIEAVSRILGTSWERTVPWE